MNRKERQKREDRTTGLFPAYRFEWRGGFDNASVDALYAEAFGHEPSDDWEGRVRQHSPGWVCAHDDEGLVGFVNVVWDGAVHAFVVDTMVGKRARHRGVGRQLVPAAAAGAGGCMSTSNPTCGVSTPTHAGLKAL